MTIGTFTKNSGAEHRIVNTDIDDDGYVYYVNTDGHILYEDEGQFEPVFDYYNPLPDQEDMWSVIASEDMTSEKSKAA